jgi:hypothetical protein
MVGPMVGVISRTGPCAKNDTPPTLGSRTSPVPQNAPVAYGPGAVERYDADV